MHFVNQKNDQLFLIAHFCNDPSVMDISTRIVKISTPETLHEKMGFTRLLKVFRSKI